MLTVERLCRRVIRLIHTPIRIYDSNGRPADVFVDSGEQQDPLACDEILLNQLLALGSDDGPRLHLEADEIIYGVIRHDGGTYILGPCCLGHDTVSAGRALARRHKMSSTAPYRVTWVSLEYFCDMLLLLDEAIAGRSMSSAELYLQCFGGPKLEQMMQRKMQEVAHKFREANTIHNPYSQERREQESIRTGDLDGLYRAFQESYTGQIGIVAQDPLRQAKNIAIVLITLASRSAMEGGLPPEVAYSMSDAFIQHVEELADIGQVEALGRQAEIDYCAAVARKADSGDQKPLITRCKALVTERLHTRVSVKDLAASLDITPEYLSRLFLKEEGVKLTEYILGEKIRASKGQLVYTDDSYEAIAHSLGFVSQSHFGQVFKKYTGMTPRRYRESYASTDRTEFVETKQKSHDIIE